MRKKEIAKISKSPPSENSGWLGLSRMIESSNQGELGILGHTGEHASTWRPPAPKRNKMDVVTIV